MPGLEVNERGEEVETISSCQRYDNVTEGGVGLDKPWVSLVSDMATTTLDEDLLGEVLPACDGVGNGKVDGVAGAPQCDTITETEEYYANAVDPFGTLRAN